MQLTSASSPGFAGFSHTLIDTPALFLSMMIGNGAALCHCVVSVGPWRYCRDAFIHHSMLRSAASVGTGPSLGDPGKKVRRVIFGFELGIVTSGMANRNITWALSSIGLPVHELSAVNGHCLRLSTVRQFQ